MVTDKTKLEEAEKLFDSINFTFYNGTKKADVYKVPVIGHALLRTKDTDGGESKYLHSVPILLESDEYEEDDFIDLEGEKLKEIIPALPGEYILKAYVPKDETLEVVKTLKYTCRQVVLIHSTVDVDWKPLFKEAWLKGIVD